MKESQLPWEETRLTATKFTEKPDQRQLPFQFCEAPRRQPSWRWGGDSFKDEQLAVADEATQGETELQTR